MPFVAGRYFIYSTHIQGYVHNFSLNNVSDRRQNSQSSFCVKLYSRVYLKLRLEQTELVKSSMNLGSWICLTQTSRTSLTSGKLLNLFFTQ